MAVNMLTYPIWRHAHFIKKRTFGTDELSQVGVGIKFELSRHPHSSNLQEHGSINPDFETKHHYDKWNKKL